MNELRQIIFPEKRFQLNMFVSFKTFRASKNQPKAG